jgi:hypothetical protein
MNFGSGNYGAKNGFDQREERNEETYNGDERSI